MALRVRVAAVGVGATVLEAGGGLWALAALGPARVALFLLACGAATAVVTMLMWRSLGRPPHGDDGEGPGPGGGPTDSDPPPAWWPEFEREFRRHVRSRRTSV